MTGIIDAIRLAMIVVESASSKIKTLTPPPTPCLARVGQLLAHGADVNAHGKHAYGVEEYGLSEAGIREEFAAYRQRFGLP